MALALFAEIHVRDFRAAKAWNRQSTRKRDREGWQRLTASLAKLGHDDLSEAVKRYARALP